MKAKIIGIANNLKHDNITLEQAILALNNIVQLYNNEQSDAFVDDAEICDMCVSYFNNNVKHKRVVNRCCPSCGSELPSIEKHI